MFSIYSKVTTPESSPILGPAQSPTLQTFEPLDSTSKQQEKQEHLLDEMGGIGLLCACCSRARGSTTIPCYGIAPLSDNNIVNVTNIQTNAPITTDLLEKCKYETHFTHYNYRVVTPRQMPPF
jgi:hypothetical protein